MNKMYHFWYHSLVYDDDFDVTITASSLSEAVTVFSKDRKHTRFGGFEITEINDQQIKTIQEDIYRKSPEKYLNL